MSKTQIKPHNFHHAISNIERFSQNLPDNPSFDKVEVDGGLFGWGDHKVTGQEMNLFIGKVQDRLIMINGTFQSVIHEFKEVYRAFDALDKEYVAGILQSIDEADKASQVAQKASEGNTKAIESLKRTVQVLAKTDQELKDFKKEVTYELSSIASLSARIASVERSFENIAEYKKELKAIKSYFSNLDHSKDFAQILDDLDSLRQYCTQLDSYKYLNEIDTIWSDVKSHKMNLTAFHQQVDSFIERVNQATNRIDVDLESLKRYRAHLESYQHISDIDTIWSDVEDHKRNLNAFHQQVDSLIERVDQATNRIDGDLESLKQYRAHLESYQHINEIDTIWSDVESQKVDLLGLHEKLESFIKHTYSEQEDIKTIIHQMEIENNYTRQQYKKKLNNSYWIGGSAVVLIVINYILQFIGVL